MTTPLRVLMSEGSSLSARESLTALGLAGLQVEVVDASPLCLARFSKWCTRFHRAPAFGEDPHGYLELIAELLAGGRFDVLYPAHEQAYLFARHRERLGKLTHLALPPFEVFDRMQSKVGFAAVLEELGLPAAPTTIVRDEESLRRAAGRLPVYVKAALGTATRGTFRVRTAQELAAAIETVRDVLDEGVLVQEPEEGALGRTQAVFAHGRLVGSHACLQVEEGVSGGDLRKESIEAPAVRAHVERIGRHLGWHGGLSLDFILGADGQPRYIDSNPRLAETGNALAAGVNLPKLLVDVSLGLEPAGCLTGRPGVRTFMGLQGLLQAGATGSRRSILRTVAELLGQHGRFSGAAEELSPVWRDPPSLVPLAVVGAALLARPANWRGISSGAVQSYAATPAVVRFVRAAED